ncbi:ABC transporter permease [Alkaliphilus peptidifermentans]|uniref:MacB-like core domain-containing protein n=1 Tax=Alkaliphilus peptidifermentans DSM 18978 TaxID=1120976 RepID=A0A1G5HM79_9FIRM|nr:ABC transporter permease [Alkaliphilus peptidifermentans]SCY64992.1 MacB-like core domain-containing protein [Alkaliphilus peptidifermentans DSM 18978]
MNSIKTFKYLFVCGVFTLLLSICFLHGISKNTETLLSTFGFNRISVEIKYNSIKSSTYGLTEGEALELKNKLKENLVLFALPYDVNIKNHSNSISVKALAVSPFYQSFADINIIKGSFLTEKQEKNKDMVLVIEEETALRLFKSTDIIGMNIDLMDNSFTIVGVNKRKNTLLSNLLKSKEPDIYIPLHTAFSFDENIKIPYLHVSISNEENTGEGTNTVIKALEDMGKSPANYRIVDYRSFEKRISQLNLIIVFMLGVFILYYLIEREIKVIKEILKIITKGWLSEYFLEAMKSSKKTLIYLVMEFIFWASSVYIIFKMIKLDFYVPVVNNNYVMYYKDIFKNNLFEAVTSKTLFQCIPYFSELLISLIFICGFSLGGLLLYISFYFFKHTHLQIDKGYLFCSLSYLAVLLLSKIIMVMSALPFVIDIKAVLIFYVFSFLYFTLLETPISIKKDLKSE